MLNSAPKYVIADSTRGKVLVEADEHEAILYAEVGECGVITESNGSDPSRCGYAGHDAVKPACHRAKTVRRLHRRCPVLIDRLSDCAWSFVDTLSDLIRCMFRLQRDYPDDA